MSKPKTVFVSGRFNILHPGHVRLLRAAKDYGSRLVVGVESDRLAGFAAHISEAIRLEGVQSSIFVDEAFIFDEDVTEVIGRLKPDLVVKGKEHEASSNPELSVLERYGGRLVFTSGESIFSSLDLLRREFHLHQTGTVSLPADYLSRHSIEKSSLRTLVSDFGNLKVCVFGDLIVDEYITCDPLGMSQEDPTIVVTPIDSSRFLGGAGIVAAHAASLGADVKFMSVTGNDDLSGWALRELAEQGVDSHIAVDETRPTTWKKRYRCRGKTLLRVSELHQEPISSELQADILAKVELALEDSDLLVFADFNYGLLTQSLVDQVIIMAKRLGVFIAADSQSSSQIGDISRYVDVDLITPTEREARISLRDTGDGLVVLAERLRRQSRAHNIIVTLGEEGLLVHAPNGTERNRDNWQTDRIEALNPAPRDASGAGDSLLIVGAMTMACGGTIWDAAILGSLAASVQVARIGNTPLGVDELVCEIT